MENSSHDNINLKVHIKLNRSQLVLSPVNKAYKYCLIWLHGLNMSVQDFFSLFLAEDLIGLLTDTKIVIPQAPKAFVNVEGREVFSWFNVIERNFAKPFDEIFDRQEITTNSKTITELIHQEAEALQGNYSRVFLGGFSGGCAMSLHVGLSLPQKLGGIIGYAGYLFEITPKLSDDRNVLVIHGHKDKIRPWMTVEHTYLPFKEKDNVKILLFDNIEHDIRSSEGRKAVYKFIRERTD